MHILRKHCLRVCLAFIPGQKLKTRLKMITLTSSNALLTLRMSCDILSSSTRFVFIYLDPWRCYEVSSKVVYSYSKKQEVLRLLEEHITENIVKVSRVSTLVKHTTIEIPPIAQIGQDYFRQIVGIPQGSILSALLCCFFYGDLEKRFGRFKDDPQSVCLPVL